MQTSKGRAARWSAAIVVSAVAAAVLGLAAPARAADDYPYRGEDSSELDSLGFYYRHCTSFVAWRLSQRGPFDNDMNGGHWYHARNWADNAERLGFVVDSNPAVGAVAHWYPGEGGATELGHVAYVDTVNADGSVFVEEYNGLNSYAYSRRGPIRAGRYIHVYDVGPVRQASEPAPATRETEIPPSIQRSVRAPVSAKPVIEDRPPVGRLTSPVAERRLRAGQIVTVSGTFNDDSRVTKVHFFAADENYRWASIGTDDHGGNGVYSITWTVNFPAGSEVSLFAEAFDEAGHPAVDSIIGLEGIAVVRAPVSVASGSSSRLSAAHDVVASNLVAHRGSLSRVNAVARPLVFSGAALAGILLIGALFGATRRRARAVRLA